jgi:hypothetical protein
MANSKGKIFSIFRKPKQVSSSNSVLKGSSDPRETNIDVCLLLHWSLRFLTNSRRSLQQPVTLVLQTNRHTRYNMTNLPFQY